MDHAVGDVWSAVISQSHPPSVWSLILLWSENQMITMMKIVSSGEREYISWWIMQTGTCDQQWSAKVIQPPSWPAITDRPVIDWRTQGVISLIISTGVNDQQFDCSQTPAEKISLHWTIYWVNFCDHWKQKYCHPILKSQRSLSNICDLILGPLFGCLWCIVQDPIVQPRRIHCRSHALLLPNWHMAESITQSKPKRK